MKMEEDVKRETGRGGSEERSGDGKKKTQRERCASNRADRQEGSLFRRAVTS